MYQEFWSSFWGSEREPIGQSRNNIFSPKLESLQTATDRFFTKKNTALFVALNRTQQPRRVVASRDDNLNSQMQPTAGHYLPTQCLATNCRTSNQVRAVVMKMTTYYSQFPDCSAA